MYKTVKRKSYFTKCTSIRLAEVSKRQDRSPVCQVAVVAYEIAQFPNLYDRILSPTIRKF